MTRQRRFTLRRRRAGLCVRCLRKAVRGGYCRTCYQHHRAVEAIGQARRRADGEHDYDGKRLGG